MFIDIIISLILLSSVVFVVPKRAKIWWIVAVVGTGAVVSLREALGVLSSGLPSLYGQTQSIVFGTEFSQLDQLSALFLVVVSICALSVVIYSIDFVRSNLLTRSSTHLSIQLFAFAVLFFSLLMVVTARGGYGFLFAWELMSISSFVTILFNAEKTEVRKAALNYLVLMHIGFVLLLAGFVTLSIKGLPVSFDSLGVYFMNSNPLPLFILFLLGFGMKAGLFPMHVWIPSTYQSAPDHISAFMSGAVSKMGIYGIVRVISYMDTELLTVGIILLCVGIATGLWGVILATLQTDIKRLLAYSSVENIGVIVMSIGLAAIGVARENYMLVVCGMGGALLHIVNHSLFKTLLFLASGNVASRTGTSSVESLGGLAKRMPVTATLFLVGVLAICALPPLNGFVSEFIIYFGLIDAVSSNTGVVLISISSIVSLSLIGGLVVFAFSKLYGIVFGGVARSIEAENSREVGGFRIAACVVPLTGILAIGFAPMLFTGHIFEIAGTVMGVKNTERYISIITPNIEMIGVVATIIVALSVVVYLVKRRSQRTRVVEELPVWGCGYQPTTSRMQYSGESFSEGLHDLTQPITKTSGGGKAVSKDIFFPSHHSFKTGHKDKVDTLFEAWWVELLRRLNTRVMMYRTGKVNYYVLYALVFLALILVLSIFDLI